MNERSGILFCCCAGRISFTYQNYSELELLISAESLQ